MTDYAPADESVSVNKLVNDFKVVFRDAESLLKASAGDLGEKAKEARTRLRATLESARGNLDHLEEGALEAAKATDRVIREHPYESMGLAFGVGLLLGVLITR